MPSFPYPVNEEERLAALKSYEPDNNGEEKEFDAIASLAAAICGTPVSLITFIDDKRQWFKSHIGTHLKENTRELSFCTHALASDDEIMIVPDATIDDRFSQNPVVTAAGITFYAGVPLINVDGFALGTLCVMDIKTQEFTDEQLSALKLLAKQVVDKLELRRKVRTLEKTNQELLNSNVLIQKFASMAAHDIKNPLSSMLLTSQALKKRWQTSGDKSCERLIDINLTSTKTLLTLVDEMLAYSKAPSLLIAKKQVFELNGFLNRVIALLRIPANMHIVLPQGRHELNISVIALEQIVLNLLSNAIRYNDKEQGMIMIRFHEDDDFYHLELEDNGIGIAPEYHHKIFGNHFTLQVTDRYNEKGSGIGLATVKDLVTALHGTIQLKSTLGTGSTFYVSLPKL
jgi:signal transduction histidine kinase